MLSAPAARAARWNCAISSGRNSSFSSNEIRVLLTVGSAGSGVDMAEYFFGRDMAELLSETKVFRKVTHDKKKVAQSNDFLHPHSMTDSPTPKITPEEIKAWLTSNDKNAAWLAKTMRVTSASASRWLAGKPFSDRDDAFLKLLIRGTMPFELIGRSSLTSLKFSEDQYRAITICSTRLGMTPAAWIIDRIRWILAGDPETRKLMLKPYALPSAIAPDAEKQA